VFGLINREALLMNEPFPTEAAQREASSLLVLLAPDNPGEGLLSAEDWIAVAARLRLTAREVSVAVLMFEGKTRLRIARQLGCAPGTVRVYIDRLFAKLNVEERVGLVLRVVRVWLGIATP
jgi:DNA-binding NarL/FixJ family response regulator